MRNIKKHKDIYDAVVSYDKLCEYQSYMAAHIENDSGAVDNTSHVYVRMARGCLEMERRSDDVSVTDKILWMNRPEILIPERKCNLEELGVII